jgi:four helix bundle protein
MIKKTNNRFEQLAVWKASHEYVLDIYRLIKKFPKEEKFALVDQLRRSSSSVPTNIVEGNERGSKKEFIQFLYTAKASLAESKYHLILAKDLKYSSQSETNLLLNKADEIGKMINGLINYLKKK